MVRQEPVEALQGDSFAPSTHVVPRREGKEESCEEVARGTNRDAMLLAAVMLSSGAILELMICKQDQDRQLRGKGGAWAEEGEDEAGGKKKKKTRCASCCSILRSLWSHGASLLTQLATK